MADLRSIVPIVGAGVLAAVGCYFLFKPKREDPDELERERRSYLNRVGRIVEGHIVEIVDHTSAAAHPPGKLTDSAATDATGTPAVARPGSQGVAHFRDRLAAASPTAKAAFLNRPPVVIPNGAQRLLYYSYSISGVTYETAQDVTGMEERIHMSRVAAGQTASVKYDPSNPSNSILLSDDWSGLH